mmetsp:Transcript_6884/g.11551  ORF Transcript_6884/g.11551 Transcript_6884/m.11551 type:complete len:511 (+) Transcript_6884:59-1591(+)
MFRNITRASTRFQYRYSMRNYFSLKETPKPTSFVYLQQKSYCNPEMKPPPHENSPPPYEWAYPLAVGGTIAFVAGALIYFNDSSSKTKASTLESRNDVPVSPPVSPLHIVDSFPSVPEDIREFEFTFRHSGSFAIAVGPADFNNHELVQHYLSERKHAMILSVHPQRHRKLFRPGVVARADQLARTPIRELLERSLQRSIEFDIIPKVEKKVEKDIMMKMKDFIQQRGPSSHQFIWVEKIDILLDYIDNIKDPLLKQKEEAMLRGFLSFIIEMSLEREWCQVLLQSNDPHVLDRLEKYMLFRTNPKIRKITLGERSSHDAEERLKDLLEENEICMKPQDITFVAENVGASSPVLDDVVKLLLSGYSVENIVSQQLQPLVIGFQKLLLESPYGVALWDLLEKMVENYSSTGKIYMPYRIIQFSPSAKKTFEPVWEDLQDFLFYYENPTLEMIRKEPAGPNSYISFSSVRALRAAEVVVNDPDLKRVMWQEKKKVGYDGTVTFFEPTPKLSK